MPSSTGMEWCFNKEWMRELWAYSTSDFWNAVGRPGTGIRWHGIENWSMTPAGWYYLQILRGQWWDTRRYATRVSGIAIEVPGFLLIAVWEFWLKHRQIKYYWILKHQNACWSRITWCCHTDLHIPQSGSWHIIHTKSISGLGVTLKNVENRVNTTNYVAEHY